MTSEPMHVASTDDPYAEACALPLLDALNAFDESRSYDDGWTHLSGIVCGICDRLASMARPQTIPATSEPDPRSIAGALRDALEQWSKHDETWAGDTLAAAAQALLDCQPDEHQPTHLELTKQLRDLRAQNAAVERHNNAQADTIDRLTHDLAHANSTIAQRDRDAAQQEKTARTRCLELIRQRDGALSDLQSMKYERDQANRDRALIGQSADEMRRRNSDLRNQIEEQKRTNNPPHATDAAYALVARAAAHLAETCDSDYRHQADRKTLKFYADGYAVTEASEHITPADYRAQLAAMLAVGASRYASRRQDGDVAIRTADHLADIAATLSGTPR